MMILLSDSNGIIVLAGDINVGQIMPFLPPTSKTTYTFSSSNEYHNGVFCKKGMSSRSESYNLVQASSLKLV